MLKCGQVAPVLHLVGTYLEGPRPPISQALLVFFISFSSDCSTRIGLKLFSRRCIMWASAVRSWGISRNALPSLTWGMDVLNSWWKACLAELPDLLPLLLRIKKQLWVELEFMKFYGWSGPLPPPSLSLSLSLMKCVLFVWLSEYKFSVVNWNSYWKVSILVCWFRNIFLWINSRVLTFSILLLNSTIVWKIWLTDKVDYRII